MEQWKMVVCRFNMEGSTKIKRTTNRAQFQKMVSIMKEHPDIAKNLTKAAPDIVQEFWKNLQIELNALGPPIKDISEWKKVWSDFKSTLRKKLANNKRELNKTGGGSYTQVVFTPLEEEVIQLVCLKDYVDGLDNTQKFGVPRKRTYNDTNIGRSTTPIPSADDVEVQLSELRNENSEFNIEEEIQNPIPQTKAAKSLKLLQKQVTINQNLYENIDKFIKTQKQHSEELISNQKKIYRTLNRLNDHQKTNNEILQEHLVEIKRHNEKMEHLTLEKNKIKMQLLELELNKAQLNLEL